MTRNKILATTIAAALAVGGAGAAIAVGTDDDGDKQATGPDADRARAAALAMFPGSEANSVERDGENGATWEVELTRADGRTVDVRLDESYGLVVVENDHEDADGD